MVARWRRITSCWYRGRLVRDAKRPMYFSLEFSVVKFNWGGYFNINYSADPKEKIVAVLMKQTQQLSGDTSEVTFIRMMYQALDD